MSKGQFFMAGILLVGLVFAVLALNLQDPEIQASEIEISDELDTSLPSQASHSSVEAEGREFMDRFESFALRQENLAGFAAHQTSFTVVLGEYTTENFEVRTAHFGETSDDLLLEVNGEEMDLELSDGERNVEQIEPAPSYEVELNSEIGSESFETGSQRWFVVNYRIQADRGISTGSYISE